MKIDFFMCVCYGCLLVAIEYMILGMDFTFLLTWALGSYIASVQLEIKDRIANIEFNTK